MSRKSFGFENSRSSKSNKEKGDLMNALMFYNTDGLEFSLQFFNQRVEFFWIVQFSHTLGEQPMLGGVVTGGSIHPGRSTFARSPDSPAFPGLISFEGNDVFMLYQISL